MNWELLVVELALAETLAGGDRQPLVIWTDHKNLQHLNSCQASSALFLGCWRGDWVIQGGKDVAGRGNHLCLAEQSADEWWRD